MKTSEAWPDDICLESQWTCFDEDKLGRESDSRWDTCIGNVHQIKAETEGGLWLWSVTADFPGTQFLFLGSGIEANHTDAGRRVAKRYKQMLSFYGRL